ncbi:glycosyltransferase [Aminithiophilus ramosus]|uniref:Glycosyltransferase n=1 Tax=Aminithiophilus ramosus TaxID=3029084 RepID=A0A9Q7EYE8_9BACT|nr:glycosyltransferase [Aminithiophilus ramosus]QTX33430.1 glycosyltransferase [Aminithiophilus ramosus]
MFSEVIAIEKVMPTKKFRLLFCSDALLVDGVTSYILHVGTALSRAGHDVAVLGRWAGQGFQRRYRGEGMTVFSCPSPTVGNAWFDAKARAFDPDVILTDSRRSFPLATRLKKVTGRPVVTYFLDHLEKTDRPGRDIASLVRWSDAWAVAEEPIRRSLVEAAPGFPIFRLPRPLDVAVAAAPLPERDPFRIVFFGRLSGYKTPGMFHLLDRIGDLDRAIPGFEIAVVGGGGWRLLRFRALAAKINRRLGRRAVVVAGTQIDPRPWLAKACLVCGGSTSAIEAALSKRPVVCFTGYWFGQVTGDSVDEALACYFGERGGRGHFSDPALFDRIVPEIVGVHERYDRLPADLETIASRLSPHFDSSETIRSFSALMDALSS